MGQPDAAPTHTAALRSPRPPDCLTSHARPKAMAELLLEEEGAAAAAGGGGGGVGDGEAKVKGRKSD